MALKDLIASKSELAEDAIEKIVASYIRYDPEARDVVFTPEFNTLSNKSKILVYLVSVQGWQFVLDDPVVVNTKPSSLEEVLGIPGGSLRPILKDLKDGHLITSKGDGYTIRAANLSSVQREIAPSSGEAKSPNRKPKSTRNNRTIARTSQEGEKESTAQPRNAPLISRKKRSASGSDIKQTFESWVSEGFFDEAKTLAAVQARFHQEAILIPRTSIPKYLLSAVRGKSLSRVKSDVSGKSLWTYQTSSKAGT